ncbi:lymphocyte activation gene 3 protein [Arapaima gigas]
MLLLVTLLGTALSMKGGCGEETEVLVGAGSTALLPCAASITSSSSALRVQWVRSSQKQQQKWVQNTVWRMDSSGMEFRGMGVGKRSRCFHANFSKGVFNLQIANTQAEDGGEYLCSVTDGTMTTNQRVTLRVIEVSILPAQAVEGSNVEITCSITPPPPSLVTMSWRLNSSSLMPENRDRLQRSSAKSQKILAVSPRHTGAWTCAVQHNGKEGKATQSLTVTGITSPAEEVSQVYAEVGSQVRLPCVYTAGVVPQRSDWSRDKGLPSSFRTPPLFSRPPWDRSAIIERVEAGDHGVYRCSGAVQGTRVQRQLQLVTAQVVTGGSKNTPTTLTCQLSDTTGIISYQWVWVTNLNGIQTVTPFHWEKTVTVAKMQSRGPGQCLCRYSGKQGILGNATYHLPFTSALEGQKKPGAVSSGMITGLVILFLVLLLIVLQLYKNHRRRKMILQYPALETIVHSSINAQERTERSRADTKALDQQTPV